MAKMDATGCWIMLIYNLMFFGYMFYLFFPTLFKWLWKCFVYITSRNPHEWFVYFFPNAEMF